MKRLKAFTLVELLVVIGIIALLISILLPSLNRARQQALSVQCASNLRQLGMAAMLFAQDHKNCIPTCTSFSIYTQYADPNHQRFVYQAALTSPGYVLVDFFSSLSHYVGNTGGLTFWTAAASDLASAKWLQAFRCPADPTMDGPNPGYMIITNVGNGSKVVTGLPVLNLATPGGYYPVSYGINADIACVNDSAGHAAFTVTGGTVSGGGGTENWNEVWNGPPVVGNPAGTTWGGSANCRLERVHHTDSVMLFADCGIRPPQGTVNFPIDHSDCLYYTSDASAGGTLGDAYNDPSNAYLRYRCPVLRHNQRLNIAFCDGHAATVAVADFAKVWISPFQPK